MRIPFTVHCLVGCPPEFSFQEQPGLQQSLLRLAYPEPFLPPGTSLSSTEVLRLGLVLGLVLRMPFWAVLSDTCADSFSAGWRRLVVGVGTVPNDNGGAENNVGFEKKAIHVPMGW